MTNEQLLLQAKISLDQFMDRQSRNSWAHQDAAVALEKVDYILTNIYELKERARALGVSI